MIKRNIPSILKTKLPLAALGACMLMLGWSCANQVPPTGGPRDEDPPEVVSTQPAHESLNFSGREVTVIFNEFVRPATYGKEIFISPLPLTRPKIIMVNKKLRIKFNEALRPNTTYVITLTGVKDQNESNEMEESFSLAFSTGDVLDSMRVQGKVYDKVIGQPLEDITVMLFDADSVPGNDFFKIRPAYISKTNASGEFSFQNLRNTAFKIYGVKDVDQSNTYSQPTELIAISRDPGVYFDDSTSMATDTLYAFLPDDAPPVVLGYNWINDSVLIGRFNEGILPERLFLTISDTLGEASRGISAFTYLGGNDNELVVLSPRKQASFSDLSFVSVSDSLGNATDSVMRLIPQRTKELEDILIKKPAYREETGLFEFFFPGILSDADTARVFLSDTFSSPPDTTGLDSLSIDSLLAERPFVPGISLKVEHFKVSIIPRKPPQPEVPYYLNLAGSLFGTPDTTYRYQLQWPDPEDFGTLQGVLRMPPDYRGAVVLMLGKEKGPAERMVYDTTYHFRRLKAGKYRVRVILDTDSNRAWTPGALEPYRLPEKIYLHPGEISIRANWEFEDFEIVVDLEQAKMAATTEEAEEETPGNSSGNKRGGGGRGRP
ncbi:MAG: hypothetical protein D6730_14140 [Bacteroidetes bacterium]|nr:MAG: hypothetical protein D6730_14140 [Bacteroidota bacterium]